MDDHLLCSLRRGTRTKKQVIVANRMKLVEIGKYGKRKNKKSKRLKIEINEHNEFNRPMKINKSILKLIALALVQAI